jgi:hypothetical protein
VIFSFFVLFVFFVAKLFVFFVAKLFVYFVVAVLAALCCWRYLVMGSASSAGRGTERRPSWLDRASS